MKQILYQGKYLTLFNEETWEYVKRNNCTGIVIVVSMTDAKKVIFVEQYRIPVASSVIEFPAGLVNDEEVKEEETLEQAAEREFLEETGYKCGKIEPLLNGPASAGLCSEKVFFFRALQLEKMHAGGGVESENITVHEVPLDQAAAWLEEQKSQGKLVDPKVYAGLYFLEKDSR
jgi:ADP-ribose pyrophosphatase